MDGHANAVGGAIVDSGRFDWTAHADKFPGLTTPDESYHGVTYTERFDWREPTSPRPPPSSCGTSAPSPPP